MNGSLLFPVEPRRFPGGRGLQVVFRALHGVGMALVLGGIASGRGHEELKGWILLTVASGVALLGIDLWKSGRFLFQGAGVAVWIKLGLLGLGNLFPTWRFEWYVAATVVASIGSHMSSGWRHFSFLAGGEKPEPHS